MLSTRCALTSAASRFFPRSFSGTPMEARTALHMSVSTCTTRKDAFQLQLMMPPPQNKLMLIFEIMNTWSPAGRPKSVAPHCNGSLGMTVSTASIVRTAEWYHYSKGSVTHCSRMYKPDSNLLFLQVARQGGASAIGCCFAHPVAIQVAPCPAVAYRAHFAGDDYHLHTSQQSDISLGVQPLRCCKLANASDPPEVLRRLCTYQGALSMQIQRVA